MNPEVNRKRFRGQLQEMLVMQRRHNEHVHAEWDQQNYPFHRAIWMECAELIEHFGWKWWKQQTQDLDQVFLEIVDIWHFGLSHLIVNQIEVNEIVESLCYAIENADSSTFIESVEDLAQSALQGEFNLPHFARVLNGVSMSLDLLYAFYIGKNALNVFRQLNGYKEGTYLKHWQDGREDNAFLVQILIQLKVTDKVSKSEIMRALAKCYPRSAVIESE